MHHIKSYVRHHTNRIARESREAIATDPDARAVAYGGAVLVYCATTLTLWAIIFVL